MLIYQYFICIVKCVTHSTNNVCVIIEFSITIIKIVINLIKKRIVFFVLFLAFDLCRFCVVIRFFHPHHNGQWPPTSKDFLSQILSITFIFLSKFLRKSQYFPFWMLSAKRGHYWYNVFGMTWSLTGDWTRDHPHSKPALYH